MSRADFMKGVVALKREAQRRGTDASLLTGMLDAAVPLWIEELRDLPWERRQEIAHECSQFIAEHGDHILFKGKHTAEAFNALARGIAVLSFAPHGVQIFGRHYSSKRPV